MDRLDFCIIGAMKAATTTLASMLARHPGVVMADPKEPGFFSRDERFARGPGWYREQFGEVEGLLVGEASTCYSRRVPFPAAAERLAAFAPDVKLIYVLRHPAERAIAHYVHEMRIRMRDGLGMLDFDGLCDQDPAVLSASEFDREIEHLLRWFSREQMLLLRFEELIESQGRVFGDVQEWLGLGTVSADAAWENRASDQVRRHEVDRRLGSVVSSRAGRAVRSVLPASLRSVGRGWLKKTLGASGGVKARVEAFDEELDRPAGDRRRALVDQYAGTVSAVESMTGWDLAAWRE